METTSGSISNGITFIITVQQAKKAKREEENAFSLSLSLVLSLRLLKRKNKELVVLVCSECQLREDFSEQKKKRKENECLVDHCSCLVH